MFKFIKKLFILIIIIGAIILAIALLSGPSDNPYSHGPDFPDDYSDSKPGHYAGCDIVFSSDLHSVGIGEQGSELYCIKKDGSNLRRITNNNYFEFHADVSPTRQEIATITLPSKGSDKNGCPHRRLGHYNRRKRHRQRVNRKKSSSLKQQKG